MDNEGVKEIAALARDSAQVTILDVNGVKFAAVPGDTGIKLESVKKFEDERREAPERRTGVAKMATLESFIGLVNRHKDAHSAIFGDLGSTPSLTAVVDYNTTDGKARFGKHRIVYPFPVSVEWQSWQRQDGKPMTQSEWAAFVEERIAELASPLDQERTDFERLFQTKIASPSDLIQLSRGMQMTVESRVKDVRVLQSGEAEVVYEEAHKDIAGNRLVIPGLFIVRIPLFLGAEPSRLIARLRYRRNDGRLTWFYQLYRADLVMRDRLLSDLEAAGKETGLPTFEGFPEA